MAKRILQDVYLTFSAQNISAYLTNFTLNYSAEIHDVTTMNAAGNKQKLSGFKDWSIEAEVTNEPALSAILFSLVGGAAAAVVVRETSGVLGADNPEYRGNGILENYPPIGGAVGDPHKASITIQGDGALTRHTA